MDVSDFCEFNPDTPDADMPTGAWALYGALAVLLLADDNGDPAGNADLLDADEVDTLPPPPPDDDGGCCAHITASDAAPAIPAAMANGHPAGPAVNCATMALAVFTIVLADAATWFMRKNLMAALSCSSPDFLEFLIAAFDIVPNMLPTLSRDEDHAA